MKNKPIYIQNQAPYIHSSYIFRRKPGEIKTYIHIWIDISDKPVFQVLSYSLTDDIDYVKSVINGESKLTNNKVVKQFKDKYLIKSSILISQETFDLMNFASENLTESKQGGIFVITED